MTNKVGSSTIYSTILPNNTALSRIKPVNLSKAAKQRLAVIEHYLTKTRNVSLTCRHFAITRSYFYKWYGRYNPRNLGTLENKSRKPHRLRQTTYNTSLVELIRKIRTDYPSYSSKKIAVILLRDFGIAFSHSTIGRIILKYKLYFRAAFKLVQQRSKRAVAVWKQRKPYGLQAKAPAKVIEFDMKHIYSCGQRQYAFVAVDIFSKQACVHVANQPSSYQAKIALETVLAVFGKNVCIVNDNGSENYRHAYTYLKDQNITQYFARPHTPKDKPHVENLIGKLQQECLDEGKRITRTLDERKAQIAGWLNDYHFFRPHQALDYLTPAEFCDTMGITIRRVEVSTM
jgi:transposase InsO family protein